MKLPPPLRRAGSASADGVCMAMTPSAGTAVGGGAAGAGTAGAGASGSSGAGVAADVAARVASAAARVSAVAGAALGAALGAAAIGRRGRDFPSVVRDTSYLAPRAYGLVHKKRAAGGRSGRTQNFVHNPQILYNPLGGVP